MRIVLLRTVSLITWKHSIFLLLLFSYVGLFCLIYASIQGLDFASFYSASKLLAVGDNPYLNHLLTPYLSIIKKTSPNLNPPILLMLFSSFTLFNFKIASVIWYLLSLSFGIIGVEIVFRYLFSNEFLKKNRLILYFFYLTFYPILMDRTVGQVGGLLLFFIMLGYHFYCQHKDYAAGILWGIIIALKLFPGLLLFYALVQKRYRVFWIAIVVVLLLIFIPMLMYGVDLYQHYFSMLNHVLWYGDNWNASYFGFLFRIFINNNSTQTSIICIKSINMILFVICLIWYLRKVQDFGDEKYSFAFTLIMMLIMSPFGWAYYFSLVIFPLILTWLDIFSDNLNNKVKFLWFLSFFMINFPGGYLHSDTMFMLQKWVNSIYFYGLALLLFLLVKKTSMKVVEINQYHIGKNYLPTVLIIISFGFISFFCKVIVNKYFFMNA